MKAKKEKHAKLLKTVIFGGLIVGATPLSSNATQLFSYNDLGTGAELRSGLLEQYRSPIDANLHLDYASLLSEAKCGEGKCGEGKCGEKKTESKKSEAKKSESKTSEAKCGEGKCGEGETKKETKAAKKEKPEKKKSK